ncbi:hypothetical protein KIPB_014423, partial [Kipferlia bialata]
SARYQRPPSNLPTSGRTSRSGGRVGGASRHQSISPTPMDSSDASPPHMRPGTTSALAMQTPTRGARGRERERAGARARTAPDAKMLVQVAADLTDDDRAEYVRALRQRLQDVSSLLD